LFGNLRGWHLSVARAAAPPAHAAAPPAHDYFLKKGKTIICQFNQLAQTTTMMRRNEQT
jgi:hypothetical protein